MPIVLPIVLKRIKAIECAVMIMSKHSCLDMNEHVLLDEIFNASGYHLSLNNQINRAQIVRFVLFHHWKNARDPKIYRYVASDQSVSYSTTPNEDFRAYADLENSNAM